MKGRGLVLLALFCGPVAAAPMLRLSSAAVVWQVGESSDRFVDAFNIGDGALSLSATVSRGDTWLTVTVGSLQACPYEPDCIRLKLSIDTSALARGTHTATVTIADPNAIDAPQTVTATVLVGGGDPLVIDQWIKPGGKVTIPIQTGYFGWCFSRISACFPVAIDTPNGGFWLSVSYDQAGTMQITGSAYIRIVPAPELTPGVYTGSVQVTKGLAPRTIPVTMRVTTGPIAVPSTDKIVLRLAEGAAAAAYPELPAISFTNSGGGALEIQGVEASGTGVFAYRYDALAVVTVDPGLRGPGAYNDGMIIVQCNAANCPLQIPVSLEIVPRAPPSLTYRGVVDNTTFRAGGPVAPGEIFLVQGEQLSSQPFAMAQGTPLPTYLGGASVYINGIAAPLFYTGYRQIAFRMPDGVGPGTALVRVIADDLISNTVSVNIATGVGQ